MTEVYLYDPIDSDPFWGVSAKNVIAALKESEGDVMLCINSPGGQVSEGLAIYNAVLAEVRAGRKVTCRVDGLAASMASVIACAGSRLIMAEASMLMIHDPSGICLGTAADMRKEAEVLETIAGLLGDIYAAKSGMSRDAVQALMTAESWLTATTAKALGFCDEVLSSPQKSSEKASTGRWDFGRYKFKRTPGEATARWGKAPPTPQKRRASMPDTKRLRAGLVALTGLLALAKEGASSDQGREPVFWGNLANALPPIADEAQSILTELDPTASGEETASLKDLLSLSAKVTELTGAKSGQVGAVQALSDNAAKALRTSESDRRTALVEQMVKDGQIGPTQRAHYAALPMPDLLQAQRILAKDAPPSSVPESRGVIGALPVNGAAKDDQIGAAFRAAAGYGGVA